MSFEFDGACIPAFDRLQLRPVSDSIKEVSAYLNNDVSIHVGYVAAIHYPGDPNFTDLKFVTYDIVALNSIGEGCSADAPYRNVRWAAGVQGSISDMSRIRLNAPVGWVEGAAFTEEMQKQASRVVFACSNGKTQSGYIIGVVDHPYNDAPDSKEFGHYSASSFNGVNTLIDKDGQYSATFTGAILDPETNAYIEAPEATTGTTILMDKEGSILLDDVKGESIKLDKTAESIVTTARSIKTDVTDKDYANTIKGKVTFLAQGNAVFDGSKIYIGREGTPSPMVKGTELAQFVQKLLQAFMSGAPIGQLGAMPVMASAALLGALAQLVPYGTPGSAFLSKKGFLE